METCNSFDTTKCAARERQASLSAWGDRLENEFVRSDLTAQERQREGIQQAKAKQLYRGGKRRLDRPTIARLAAEGSSMANIADQLGCSRMQIYRILRET